MAPFAGKEPPRLPWDMRTGRQSPRRGLFPSETVSEKNKTMLHYRTFGRESEDFDNRSLIKDWWEWVCTLMAYARLKARAWGTYEGWQTWSTNMVKENTHMALKSINHQILTNMIKEFLQEHVHTGHMYSTYTLQLLATAICDQTAAVWRKSRGGALGRCGGSALCVMALLFRSERFAAVKLGGDGCVFVPIGGS